MEWTAVVLAGGRGSRLGGVEKSDLVLHGRSLLEHVVSGLTVPTIVVGPSRDVSRSVSFCLEEPRYGGPVAGLRAALPLIDTPVIGLIAVDLPLAVGVIPILVAHCAEVDAVVASVDGRDQYVCAAFCTSALEEALVRCGDSMKSLFSELKVLRVEVDPRLLRDVDTQEDLERLKREPSH